MGFWKSGKFDTKPRTSSALTLSIWNSEKLRIKESMQSFTDLQKNMKLSFDDDWKEWDLWKNNGDIAKNNLGLMLSIWNNEWMEQWNIGVSPWNFETVETLTQLKPKTSPLMLSIWNNEWLEQWNIGVSQRDFETAETLTQLKPKTSPLMLSIWNNEWLEQWNIGISQWDFETVEALTQLKPKTSPLMLSMWTANNWE